MTKIVDARGLACPQPVILTKKVAIGIVSNMYDIAETLLGAGKVVTP
jgi:hypothetical protein